MTPCIDKSNAGSKTVKTNRSAIWHIKVKGEPPPTFSWYKDGKKLNEGDDEYIMEREAYQGGATAILHIFKTQVILHF